VLPSVAILCGGRGTRLHARDGSIPKALVEIGGRPIVWHVIQIYAAHGFRRFVLLTGYLSSLIERFAADTDWGSELVVECVDTGIDTPTGGRVARAGSLGMLGADGRFCLTYADGVADIDLGALIDSHGAHGVTATMTVVRPELPFGVAEMGGDGLVSGFVEKPVSERWVNGGFFCFEPEVLSALADDSVLEREPLERLALEGRLAAYRHEGFWQCMDTYKDAARLDELWSEGRAPWRIW